MNNVIFVNANQMYATSPIDLNAIPDNNICLYYYDKDGVRKNFDSNAAKFRWLNQFHIFVKSTVFGTKTLYDIPVCKPGLTYVKSDYKADINFNANFVVNAPTLSGEYTVIIVKRGAKNDERFRWVTSVYVDRPPMDATKLAERIVKDINSKKDSLNITASNNNATVTLVGTNAEDFEIILTDGLSGIQPTYVTRGLRGQNDKKFIMDILAKHASNFGYNYTADGAELYPGYETANLDIIAANGQFTVYTLTFVNTRDVENVGDNIKQRLYVVCPTTRSFTAAFEDVLNQCN